MSRGILTLACGNRRYLRMAGALVRSIRLRDPSIPVVVATDRADALAHIPARTVTLDASTVRGVEHKLNLDRYSPFDETLFIDSDCLVFRPAEELFKIYRCATGFGVIAFGELGPCDSHISIRDLAHFLRLLGIQTLPAFNGGIYYFDRSREARDVFRLAREIFRRRDELGLRPFKIAGAADEPIIGAALRLAGIPPIEWDSARAMGTALDCFDTIGGIDVISGRSDFVKLGHHIAPAVIHFNMNAQHCAVYRRECLRLRLGPGFPMGWQIASVAGGIAAAWHRISHGIRQRMPIAQTRTE